MFISRKKLNRIIEEERTKARDEFWKEQDRQREMQIMHKRIDEVEARIWKLIDDIEKRSRKRKPSCK